MCEQGSYNQLNTTLIEDGQLIELTRDEIERLANAPILSEFHRQKLDKDAKKNWDLFYKRNGDRFFKNRYWTKHEFQELFDDEIINANTEDKSNKVLTYLLEIGCGCGDFALPLLNDSCDKPRPKKLFIYCCDISDRAIEILKTNSMYIRHNPGRMKAFVADITTQDVSQIVSDIDGLQMDIVSLVFILSALDPKKMRRAIENVHILLKPGGLVLFRDYAIYDKAMLRFGQDSKVCDQFYVRQDGTRAYFFSKNQLIEMFESCNFHCKSIDYVRRETVNNATKDKFSRIFLQAKFEKK